MAREARRQVHADQPLLDVMTDKATVTIPSGVDGRVINTHGEVGETVAVGCELVSFDLSSKAFEPAAVAVEISGRRTII